MMNAVPTETALLGGGCFWCLEAVFNRVEGVIEVEPGYAGGPVPNPTYEQVCGGRTGHAEVLRISFDTSIIGFAELLEVFFALHDPTTENRQGNDVGTQYRSVVFCRDGVQAATARNVIAQLTAAQRFAAPIVTRVEGDVTFWPAEPYHFNYYDHNPLQPYCMAVVAPKIDRLRRLFATRVKTQLR
ncbi:peptide-methionine (S)-S-oxide reductase [Methyloversatilis sp. RAC08]|nr:peptide-methionine (S)-S-oxide reductase [Methyloversatilis sp. RAC08]